MRTVFVQGAPAGNPDQKMTWLEAAVRALADASNDNDTTDIASNFAITGTFTTVRTLNASTATLADVINVFCTLLTDLQKGGSVRTG